MYLLQKAPLFLIAGALGTFTLLTEPPAPMEESPKLRPVEQFASCSTCNENGSTHYFSYDCCVPGFDSCRQCSWSYPASCHSDPAQNLCPSHNKCVVE